jgi:hypothetical protein
MVPVSNQTCVYALTRERDFELESTERVGANVAFMEHASLATVRIQE